MFVEGFMYNISDYWDDKWKIFVLCDFDDKMVLARGKEILHQVCLVLTVV